MNAQGEKSRDRPSDHLKSEWERARLTELGRYGILDSEPEEAFDRIVGLTQRLFKMPIVFISFVDRDRQWFKSCYGLDSREIDRSLSFCSHAIGADEVMVVPDAAQDARFALNPFVTGEPGVPFYAGAPLRTPDAYTLGTLCIIDTVPHRDFSEEARATLADLAAMVIDELELRLAAQQVQRHAARTQTVLESITEAFYTVDTDWRFTFLNTQAERLLRRTQGELLGRELWTEFPDVLASGLEEKFRRAAGTGEAENFEFFYPPLGAWFEVHAYPSDEGLSVYFQDISARKEDERVALLQTTFRERLFEIVQASLQSGLGERAYQGLLEGAVEVVPGAQAGSLLLKDGERYRFVAAAGYDLEALKTCTFAAKNVRFDPQALAPQLIYDWETERHGEEQQTVLEGVGRATDIEVSLALPVLIEGEINAYFCLDSFESKDAFGAEAVELACFFVQQTAALMQRLTLEAALHKEREALERLAHYDTLTGLPNRRLFDDRLEQASAQARRSGEPLGVMLLDLDGFKDVNDSYGHAFGDLFLQAVAARLSANLREGDTLSRWGGDEFVIIAPGLSGPTQARTLAERLLAEMHKPFYLLEREIRTGASIGIDVCSGAVAVADEMVQNADIALYRAKASKGAYQFFDPAMKERLRRRLELGEELRAALEEGALTLHYQPRIDLKSGHITSLEALARWPHPQRGFVPPSSFIPLAEELGLIRLLGAQVLEKACAQAKSWCEAGLPHRVAVNVSVEQLKHPAFVEEVAEALRRCALEPSLLELELTESTAMTDVEGSIEKLQQLRAMGVHLAIDDFGTAYSSLAYLKRLPVHSLKIDRSFVSDLGGASDTQTDTQTELRTGAQTGVQMGVQTAEDTGIIRAILALACSLGLTVVAEGVETQSQQKTLQQLGCHEAQGYLYAAPLAAEKVERLLHAKMYDPFGVSALQEARSQTLYS